jgi:hypothetical protein
MSQPAFEPLEQEVVSLEPIITVRLPEERLGKKVGNEGMEKR